MKTTLTNMATLAQMLTVVSTVMKPTFKIKRSLFMLKAEH